MITHECYLNMIPNSSRTTIVKVSQYDDDFTIIFHLVATGRGIVPPYPSAFSNDVTFTVPSGTTAEIRGTKKDGNGYSATATVDVSASTVTVTGHKQMTAVAGNNIFEIVLYYNNKELSSANFILEVERAAMDAGTVPSESVIMEIEEAVEEYMDEHDIVIDDTLTQQGKAAEAKAVGDEITSVKEEIIDAMALTAGEFSTSTDYAVGDYAIRQGVLYRFTSAHSAGSWNISHVTAVSVCGDIVGNLNNALRDFANYNNTNLVSLFPQKSRIYNDVEYDWVNHTCRVHGTASAISYYNIFDVSTFEVFKKGETYHVIGATSDVHIRVYAYVSGSSTELVNATDKDSFTVPSGATRLYARIWVAKNSVVDQTIEPIIVSKDWYISKGLVSGKYSSADDILENDLSIFYFNSSNPLTNVPSGVSSGWIITTAWPFPINNKSNSANIAQICIPKDGSDIKRRIRDSGTWGSWEVFLDTASFLNNAYRNYPTGLTSCDDISGNVVYTVTSSGGTPSLSNFAFTCAGWIANIPFGASSPHSMQVAYPYDANFFPKYRIKRNGTWDNWSGFGASYVTEVNRDEYNNTYNITTSPTITTDTNGWLQPVDTDTSDETGKTDMTGAIMSMLTNTGYCHLAPGIYYVSGGIDMPEGSMIEGCGDQTIIRLLQSVTSGYIIRMHTRSTLKNVHLSGSGSALDTDSGTIGGRKGVIFIGNRDGNHPEITPSLCKLCMIDGCWFKNLDSGIYGYNSGGGLQEGITVSNCYFHCCKAGINFDYRVEYSKVTNCVTYKCHYGCINNGGNNVFTACTFHGVIGFFIDNSGSDKANKAHGSCVGCTFNHIANWIYTDTKGGGAAVKILNVDTAGFIFTGCQFWYGNIDIETGFGVAFSDCLFGGQEGNSQTSSPRISVTGQYAVFFGNCIFRTAPVLSLNSETKMDNCYLAEDGSAITNN